MSRRETFFNSVSEFISEEANDVVDYFEETWIGPVRRNRKRAPVFPIEMWNCHNSINEGIPKTNNHLEGWHLAFESQLTACHPSIWKFIEAIQREQSLTEMKMVQSQSGISATPRKQKYVALDLRIRAILEEFSEEHPLTFLSNLAANISL